MPSWGRELWEELARTNTISLAVSEGRFYIATSARVTAGLGENIRGLVSNPVDSGRLTIMVALIATVAPDRMTVGRVHMNPDTGLPATNYVPFNTNRTVNNPAVTTFRVDNNITALGGGTATDLYTAVHKGRNQIPLPGIILAPGQSLGINIPLGATETGDGAFATYFYEKDL